LLIITTHSARVIFSFGSKFLVHPHLFLPEYYIKNLSRVEDIESFTRELVTMGIPIDSKNSGEVKPIYDFFHITVINIIKKWDFRSAHSIPITISLDEHRSLNFFSRNGTGELTEDDFAFLNAFFGHDVKVNGDQPRIYSYDNGNIYGKPVFPGNRYISIRLATNGRYNIMYLENPSNEPNASYLYAATPIILLDIYLLVKQYKETKQTDTKELKKILSILAKSLSGDNLLERIEELLKWMENELNENFNEIRKEVIKKEIEMIENKVKDIKEDILIYFFLGLGISIGPTLFCITLVISLFYFFVPDTIPIPSLPNNHFLVESVKCDGYFEGIEIKFTKLRTALPFIFSVCLSIVVTIIGSIIYSQNRK
jgi:hypothetical protein